MFIGKPFISKQSETLINVLICIGALLVLTLLIFSPYIPYSITLNEGDISDTTFFSPRDLHFESSQDQEKNRLMESDIQKSVGKIYSINPSINETIHGQIELAFEAIHTIQLAQKQESPIPYPPTLDFLNQSDLLKTLSALTIPLSKLQQISLLATDKILANGIQDINREAITTQIDELITVFELNVTEKQLIKNIMFEFLQPNLIFDKEKTEGAIQQALKAYSKFSTIYREGQPILYRGDKVTAHHIEVLKALNIYEVRLNRIKVVAIFFFCFLCFLFLERFLYFFRNKLHKKRKYYLLVFFVTVIILIAARSIQLIDIGPSLFNLKFLIPIPIAGVIISLLVTPNISLLCGTLIACLVTVMFKGDFQLFLYLFLSQAVSTFSNYKIEQRSEFIRSGYVVGLFNVGFVIVIGLFQEVQSAGWYGANMSLGLINGFISSMISLALMPYLEALFSITTNQKLLELSNLNHPLLKRLMLNAPGTYQHSLMVANLAEAAAQKIGANPILCRVGSYYHDIGKMKRPIFFSENQFSGDNPHESLSPRISKMIIASHTKDGVEMAAKHKLPDVIQDIILQHHGTTLVSFFFTQAVQKEELSDHDESIKEAFRYTGPKPNFIESGIVMLADSVEAATRSLEKPTPQKIETLIDKIIKDKVDDGQFDDCPITLKEIKRIKQAFLSVFQGVHHHRIDYEDEIQTMISSQKKPKKNDSH